MKSPPKKTRHKLIVEDHEPDHYLGLASAEADYRLSLILNRELGLNLKSKTPVVKFVNDREISFPRFTSASKYNETIYELICNESEKDKLFPRIPSIDYILRIRNLPAADPVENIIMRLRQIREITGVFLLDKGKQLDNSVLQIIP